ncbi:MAG: hypothetical protein F6K22_34555 [Okeania sp. SIO2F4]|uniref:hypothetical protein n=1 Tax=Okeania sp. SIO2F4 TaxID=2607790 RepID=UPI00142C075C|nr:hypothetical protein [Okeania sp. SIO2F4]NES07470.1 hypothetical protein [Okeania sp. SIO2F4]
MSVYFRKGFILNYKISENLLELVVEIATQAGKVQKKVKNQKSKIKSQKFILSLKTK